MATRSPFSDLEIQSKFAGNGHKDLSLSGRPILGADGHQMILLAIQDITQSRLHEAERAQLLASAQRAGAAAERANHAKDLFLALLSHELRTPLNSILLATQVLGRVLKENPIVQRMSTTVERAVAAQTRLIDDLLDTARITSGKLLLDLQAVDLGTVVRTAVDVARSSAELKGVELTVTVSASLGPIYGDPARLQQVVGNLLSNAIKFTPRGGTIAVCVDKAHGQAQIEVTDTGMGISPELLPRIFERFIQADSAMTRTYGGLGLGLAIVRHLVEVHGGKVEAESPGEGRGATFRVLLPFAAHASLSGTSASRESVRSIADVRVLLIDDDESTREACVAALAIQGANALGAGSAAEGLAALETFHPQVILCDIAMPMHDGYYFLHQLRSLDRERGGQTPIAALTALASAEDRLRALEAGFQLHLVKPINSAGLTAAVATLVDWTQPIDGPVQPAQ